MRIRNITSFATVLLLLFQTNNAFSQQFNYDEQADGDLSVNSNSPVFQFGVGTNTITASAYTYVGGTLDADRFEFLLAPNSELATIRLTITNGTPLQTTVEVGPTFLISDPMGSFFAGTGGIDAISFTQPTDLLAQHLPMSDSAYPRLSWGSGGYITGTPPVGGSWDYVLEFIVESLDSDLDNDTVSDSIDNCLIVANPDQVDSDADNYGNQCDADFDNNCIVNFLDLFYFKSMFLTGDEIADLNTDGVVNFLDMSMIVNQFSSEPGPSALTDQCNTN